MGMEMKGIAVKVTPDFVQDKYDKRYIEWIKSLPQTSRIIFEQTIYPTSWYDLYESIIVPTQKVGDLFYEGDHTKAAFELGEYSAKNALTGSYSIFIRVASPHFVLNRASSIFSLYFKPASNFQLAENSYKRCVIMVENINPNEELLADRVAGWVSKTIEITLKSIVKVEIKKEINDDLLRASIAVDWQ